MVTTCIVLTDHKGKVHRGAIKHYDWATFLKGQFKTAKIVIPLYKLF